MSYILDALRRSEEERRQLEPNGFVAPPESDGPGRRRWLPWLLGAALAMNSAALAWILLRQSSTTPPAPAATEPAPVTPAPEPAPGRTAPLLADLVGTDTAVSPPAQQNESPRAAEPPRSPPQVPTTPGPQAAAGAQVATAEPLPLEALPAEFQRAVPDIGVSVHVYAQQASARWVMIDGRRYGENQDLPSGVRLEQITPTGMVLAFRGERFLLKVR